MDCFNPFFMTQLFKKSKKKFVIWLLAKTAWLKSMEWNTMRNMQERLSLKCWMNFKGLMPMDVSPLATLFSLPFLLQLQ